MAKTYWHRINCSFYSSLSLAPYRFWLPLTTARVARAQREHRCLACEVPEENTGYDLIETVPRWAPKWDITSWAVATIISLLLLVVGACATWGHEVFGLPLLLSGVLLSLFWWYGVKGQYRLESLQEELCNYSYEYLKDSQEGSIYVPSYYASVKGDPQARAELAKLLQEHGSLASKLHEYKSVLSQEECGKVRAELCSLEKRMCALVEEASASSKERKQAELASKLQEELSSSSTFSQVIARPELSSYPAQELPKGTYENYKQEEAA